MRCLVLVLVLLLSACCDHSVDAQLMLDGAEKVYRCVGVATVRSLTSAEREVLLDGSKLLRDHAAALLRDSE